MVRVAAFAAIAACATSAVPHRSHVPATVDQHLETLKLRLTEQPPDHTGPTKLLSVDLGVPLEEREPDAVGPDGRPVSAYARLTAGQASALVRALDDAEFFANADHYVSERQSPADSPPPAGARLGSPTSPEHAHLQLEVIVAEASWYHYFARAWPWTSAARAPLLLVRARLQGRARDLVDRLLDQLPDH